jgi:putative tricarboxylic transport membrane protein
MADTRAGPAWPETLIGLGVLALSLLVFEETWTAPAAPAYAQVGPTAFPYGAGVALAILGALLTVAGASGGWRDPAAEAELGQPNFRGVAWVVAGLLINAALIGWLGFILASTILFACVARGFSSDRPPRDLAIGFALSFVSYIGFAKLLAIKLGEGPIERLF